MQEKPSTDKYSVFAYLVAGIVAGTGTTYIFWLMINELSKVFP